MKKMPKWVRILLIVLLLALAAYFCNDVMEFARSARKNKQIQNELEQLYQRGSEGEGQEAEEIPKQVPGYSEQLSGCPSPRLGPKDQRKAEKPDILPEYQKLYERNQDIVGWLKIGEELSTPVMQKNNDYYLTHDFYGEPDKHGQVFLDERNQIDLSDDHLVIYGHNIPSDKSMFYILTNYRRQEYCEEYPTFSFHTLYQKGEYAILSVFLASTLPEQGEVFDYNNQLNFDTKEEKEAYLAELKKRSLFDFGVEADSSDSLLTLSTCVYDFSGARLAVAARRLRPGESAADFGTVVGNPNPLMPEIWDRLYH